MNRLVKSPLIQLFIIVLLLIPTVASAQNTSELQDGFNRLYSQVGSDLVRASDPAESIINGLIVGALSLVGGLSMLALVFGAVRIVTAFGDDNQVSQGKNIVKWAIIGLSVALLSFLIISIAQELIT